ncbi:MAG: NtaA/DmoA family FMN-dependent monooxygenase, partial [Shinella sp.]
VLYKLLEGSWEEGAVIRDKERGIFADPAKIHEIGHKGKYFDVPGYHLSEPSPQRTPVLFQAGASGAGKEFAAGHAECVFISTPLKDATRAYVSDIRQRAAAQGRDPKKILIYAMATIIVDETDAKARAKYEEYVKYASYDGSLVLMSGWTGIDFGQYRPNDTVKKVKTNAIISAVENLSEGNKVWTIEELAKWGGIGGLGPLFVGSPRTIADLLQEWVAETDIDGFNLAYALAHESFADVIGYVVPELQRRGVYATGYREGTLRDKLFGDGPYLPESHPAHRFRDIEKVKREEAQRASDEAA